MYQALRIAYLLLTLIALAAAGLAADAIGGGGLLAVGLVVIAVLSASFVFKMLRRWAVSRASRQYAETLKGNDMAVMKRKQRALLSLVRRPRGRSFKDLINILEAEFLAKQGQFEESLKMVESIPWDGLDQNLLPSYLFSLAWTKVQTGNIDEGVGLVRQALELDAVKASSDRQTLFHGVLGTALILTNRPGDALPLISPILENENPSNRSCAAHYMGLAFKALGRSDEARASFERSVNEAPQSLWGQRSRAVLADNHVAS